MATRSKPITLIKPPALINQVKISNFALNQVLRVYLSRTHQATKKTKSRNEVVGSSRKIYRQKGSGRARHGAITAPIFVGGGVTHGPSGVSKSKLKLNKKLKNKALAYLLKIKADKKLIFSFNSLKLTKPNTKNIYKLLLPHLSDKQTLFVYSSSTSKNLILSLRNLKNIKLISASKINPLHLARFNQIIFTPTAFKTITTRINKSLH